MDSSGRWKSVTVEQENRDLRITAEKLRAELDRCKLESAREWKRLNEERKVLYAKIETLRSHFSAEGMHGPMCMMEMIFDDRAV